MPHLQVRRGLGDRAPAVRAEVAKLVMQWLEDSCEGEPLRLVHQLDVQRHPGWWLNRREGLKRLSLARHGAPALCCRGVAAPAAGWKFSTC